MHKKVLITTGCIILIIIVLGVVFCTGKMITCQTTKISINGVVQQVGGENNVIEFLNACSPDFGLSNDEYSLIKADPDQYEIVGIAVNLNNCSPLTISDVGIVSEYSQALSNLVIGSINTVQSDDQTLVFSPMARNNFSVAFIIRSQTSSNNELIQELSKSNFMLTGKGGIFNIKVHIKNK